MALDAGAVVTADELRRLRPTVYDATATSDLAAGQTAQPVPGASITLDTETDGAVFVAEATFDFDGVGSGSTAHVFGFLAVDGVTQSGEALFQVSSASANVRAVVGQMWRGTLAGAGSHTFALLGTTPGSAGNGIEINSQHTKIRVTIYEVV